MNTSEKALFLHKEWNGKLETTPKSHVKSREDLALAYTVCALRKQNNQEEAIRRYAAFTKDYRRVMNEEYGIAFADIKV